MRAAPRAAPNATVLRGRAKRKPRVGVSGHPAMAASTSAPFFTVDETALADLNAFLRDARELVCASDSNAKKKTPRAERVTLVLGNEAADLDSVACAISLAYALHEANDDASRAYVPVVCVPREDFSLRADARWLLESVGVDVDALTFGGEIAFGDASGPIVDDRLRLVLVDHNALASASEYASFASAVDAVVDHHDDEKKYPATAAAAVVPTGSCATLVAEPLVLDRSALAAHSETATRVFRETGPPTRLCAGDPRAALLLAAVLLDTQNLNASATRVHARDEAVAPILASLAGTGDPVRFHDELKRRRFDQSGLSPRDLLRRDYKQWRFVGDENKAWDVGVASFGVPLGNMAGDARAIRDACESFARERSVDALALMCAFDDEDTRAFRRQFAICFFDRTAGDSDARFAALQSRLVEPGGALSVALGGLEPVADETARDAFGGFAFEQGDPKGSRKKAQPALAAFFENASSSRR
jgi:exopolyphosphatase